ncbi:DNA-binding transcriptional regulator [Legionella moravica]|uniref:DNA-binding transcriptional regulator n=1 Tax=Legionella moravica TaxID=39962 RepID=A0A378JYP3_9GAMM|nr:XRE family transcriptional regulator [Legionella moravica]KTD37363.1 DNA-binding transcriptional regulator [Legionella moravica]STX63160.1 DNA-binding transcriptional regulator [Legionella moravica]
MENIYKHIATTLKDLRQKKGWSLDKAAAATGVSKAMLGQIEREESSPTIATLWKIATGFETSFSSFIEEIDLTSSELKYRTGQVQTIHPDDKKIRVLPLFPFEPQLSFELFVIELLPGCEHLSPPHKQGVIEHVAVIQGTVEVLIDGVWQKLSNGDGIRFNANQLHGYRNLTSETALFHDIIHYPQTP